MRNPDRLYHFYAQMHAVHADNFGDNGFIQFVIGGFQRLGCDPFFPEENDMLKAFRDYAEKSGSVKADEERRKSLEKTYAEIRDIHRTAFPDWRFGQLVTNLLCETGISEEDLDMSDEEAAVLFRNYAKGFEIDR